MPNSEKRYNLRQRKCKNEQKTESKELQLCLQKHQFYIMPNKNKKEWLLEVP